MPGRHQRLWFWGVCIIGVLSIAFLWGPGSQPSKALPDDFILQKVTIPSDSRIKRGMSLEGARRPVTEADFVPLVQSGVNWIVQTPFGWQREYNSPNISLRPDAGWWGESDEGLIKTHQMAQKFGIQTLLKPHIWLNRSDDGKWRSDIGMDSEAEWQQWFDDYNTFILHYARLAEANDMAVLCIGTELYRSATEREADWRAIIKAVRAVYSGQLIYAGNWYREYEEIRFWDALDYIGIQGYFPLSQSEQPTVEDLQRGWLPHFQVIDRLQKRYGKPVIFTEIGYHSAVDAAIKPWEWRSAAVGASHEAGLQTQVNCYEAFFRTFWHQEWFAGAFWWKWYPDHQRAASSRYNTEFTPQHKPAERLMQQWYNKSMD